MDGINGGIWIVVVLCGLATFIWRFLGVVFARKIDVQGPLFEWVTCVSYAMVAGLVFRMILLPQNDLLAVPLEFRLLAVSLAFAAYFAFKRVLVAGVLVGAGSMALMVQVFGF